MFSLLILVSTHAFASLPAPVASVTDVATVTPTAFESFLNTEPSPKDQARVDQIHAILDNVGIGWHRPVAAALLVRFKSDHLIRAAIQYMRRGAFMDGKMTARFILTRAVYKRFGDPGLLALLNSGHVDMSRAALERIKMRLGGLTGAVRGLTGLGAPQTYRRLPADQKLELAYDLLMSTEIGDEFKVAGMVESLGRRADMRELTKDLQVRHDGMAAKARVGRDLETSTVNACALALELLP